MVLFNYSVFSPLGSAVRAEEDLIFFKQDGDAKLEITDTSDELQCD